MTETMLTSNDHTVLKPEIGYENVELKDHALFFVCQRLRNVYLREIKNYIRPVFHLDYADITTPLFLDSITGPYEFPCNARSFKLTLYIKAANWPLLLLMTDEELALLGPFVQKFRLATDATVDWHNAFQLNLSRISHHGTVDFITAKIERILQGVTSLKKMQVARNNCLHHYRTSMKLLCGRWTSDMKEYNLEVMKEMMKESRATGTNSLKNNRVIVPLRQWKKRIGLRVCPR
jgi:hypothetical protein